MSQTPPQTSAPVRKHSLQMRAVLHVLKADPHLYERVFPIINFDTETIFWNEIFCIE